MCKCHKVVCRVHSPGILDVVNFPLDAFCLQDKPPCLWSVVVEGMTVAVVSFLKRQREVRISLLAAK